MNISNKSLDGWIGGGEVRFDSVSCRFTLSVNFHHLNRKLMLRELLSLINRVLSWMKSMECLQVTAAVSAR